MSGTGDDEPDESGVAADSAAAPSTPSAGERPGPGPGVDSSPSQPPDPSGSTLAGLVRELRPNQWYKQVILFVPLVFSERALDPGSWLLTVAGAVLFSALAGSVYILNDIADREADRQHPRKRHRPIASGQVSVRAGAATAGLLVGASLSTAWFVDRLLAVVLGLYLLQNLLYSTVLKRLFLVDLFVIAGGFVLRALAGVFLLEVVVSPWLILATFLSALLLGAGKRRAELRELDDPAAARDALDEYSPKLLDFVLFTVAAALLVVYSLYTFSARRIEMMFTLPFATFALLRYAHLVYDRELSEPRRLLFDLPTVVNFALWGTAVVLVLYLLPRLDGALAVGLPGWGVVP